MFDYVVERMPVGEAQCMNVILGVPASAGAPSQEAACEEEVVCTGNAQKTLKTSGFMRIGKYLGKNGGFGMNELLGVAAALILAAFIIIPGLRDFSETVITRLTTWWTGTVVSSIFPTT